jgi:hypothetical protein
MLSCVTDSFYLVIIQIKDKKVAEMTELSLT